MPHTAIGVHIDGRGTPPPEPGGSWTAIRFGVMRPSACLAEMGVAVENVLGVWKRLVHRHDPQLLTDGTNIVFAADHGCCIAALLARLSSLNPKDVRPNDAERSLTLYVIFATHSCLRRDLVPSHAPVLPSCQQTRATVVDRGTG